MLETNKWFWKKKRKANSLLCWGLEILSQSPGQITVLTYRNARSIPWLCYSLASWPHFLRHFCKISYLKIYPEVLATITFYYSMFKLSNSDLSLRINQWYKWLLESKNSNEGIILNPKTLTLIMYEQNAFVMLETRTNFIHHPESLHMKSC